MDLNKTITLVNMKDNGSVEKKVHMKLNDL